MDPADMASNAACIMQAQLNTFDIMAQTVMLMLKCIKYLADHDQQTASDDHRAPTPCWQDCLGSRNEKIQDVQSMTSHHMARNVSNSLVFNLCYQHAAAQSLCASIADSLSPSGFLTPCPRNNRGFWIPSHIHWPSADCT